MPVEKKLRFSGPDLLACLLKGFEHESIRSIPADLRHACRVVRRQDPAFLNHAPVLAVSIGGSTSAAMLVENRNGSMTILDAVRMSNPSPPEPWTTYLDRLVMDRPQMASYLKRSEKPIIGTSIAVPFINGVPEHPSKIDQLEGLVCRDVKRHGDDYHFPTNLNRWLVGHGCPKAQVFCEGDAPLAHLGGLAGANVEENEATMLLVCGTGLACADDSRFILPSMYPILDQLDADLFPPDLTENGQFQYLCAGKGIYRIMRRILQLDAKDKTSPLFEAPDPEWLALPSHSRRVYDLWATNCHGHVLHADLNPIKASYKPLEWNRILHLASLVAKQAVDSIAAASIASLSIHPEFSGKQVRYFCEGSIARDPLIYRLIVQESKPLLAAYQKASTEKAPASLYWQHRADRQVVGEAKYLGAVDQTLIGAAAMAMVGLPAGDDQ